MIVQACLNGGHPPSYHPAIPVTIRAMLEDGRKVIAAGASEIHLHVRGEDGLESLAPKYVDATITALKTALPGTLIGISTGAWIEKDDDRLLGYVDRWSALPDYASVNLSEWQPIEQKLRRASCPRPRLRLADDVDSKMWTGLSSRRD
jgi:uncharacterized protein (DUF849 family)